MQEDEESQFLKTLQILEEIGISTVTATDCANVAYVCSVVSRRAAYMVAAGIASLLKRINKPYVTVGVDGSVYRFHPTFPELLDKKIDELLDSDLEVSFESIKKLGVGLEGRGSKNIFFQNFLEYKNRKIAPLEVFDGVKFLG